MTAAVEIAQQQDIGKRAGDRPQQAFGAPPPVCRQKRTSATVMATIVKARMSPAVATSDGKGVTS